MKTLWFLVAGLLVGGFVLGVRAEDNKPALDKEKLVGSWEVVKSEEPPPPVGAVITFAKDGKMKVTHKQGDKEVTMEGTYAVDGDKINVVLKREGEEIKHSITIKKIGDETVVAENDKGKAFELKKKK
jgi:uncharacterized protein (TIGR03066 family)